MCTTKAKYSKEAYKRNKQHERERYYGRVKPVVTGKYSDDEDVVVLDPSMTMFEKAVALKRSVKSVETRRRYLRKTKGIKNGVHKTI